MRPCANPIQSYEIPVLCVRCAGASAPTCVTEPDRGRRSVCAALAGAVTCPAKPGRTERFDPVSFVPHYEGLHSFVLLADVEADPRKIGEQGLGDLLVDLSARRLVGGGDAFVDQLVDIRVGIADEVTALFRLEVAVDKTVRIDEPGIAGDRHIEVFVDIDGLAH